MSDREKLSILVTEEQKDTIYSLFGHYGWELHETEDSNLQGREESSTQTECTSDSGEENVQSEEIAFVIPQNQERNECPFCFCKPCITDESNRQMWWETENQPQHRRNNSLRKEKYKYF